MKNSVYPSRQLFFYVTLLLSGLVASLAALEPAAGLTEDNLPLVGGERENKRKTYLYHQIHYLREAVRPRAIAYLDAALYRDRGVYGQNGILFTIKQPAARQVFFLSDADNFKPRLMTRGKRGVWYYLYAPEPYDSVEPRRKLRYKFRVDDHFQVDTSHEQREEDGAGGFLSVYYLTEDDLSARQGVLVLRQSNRFQKEVLFRLRAPGAGRVSLVGNFNNWNSDLDIFANESPGVFVLKKTLPPGEYTYLFKVDGETKLDVENHNLRYHPVFGKVSYFKVP